MAEAFLEERLPVNIKMGASYGDEYTVEISKTSAGKEYRHLVHPFPVRYYTISYVGKTEELWDAVVALYHRAYGMYAGFRVRALDDFSTNGNTGAPTAFDQTLALVSTGVYQLQKQYGSGGTPLSIGLPVRTLFKPVSGTVKVAIGALQVHSATWSVNTTTGKVTFAADKTRSVSGITKASQAVVTVGSHTFTTNDSVYISDVVGMTQINHHRYSIVATGATTITLDVDSRAFSTYSTGGVVHTRPQTGEVIKGGCEFDIPFRFNSRIDLTHAAFDVRATSEVEIVELIDL